ncbi:hypothetical protein C9374_004319 [Naegleria lovaniensis]|uniref:Helicase ATP-binding domain-containing protein n=1 Tax=Naegleria lovaniensis TaxID=51637 RepID=A0AA88GSH3_NAELO|nr:uncharacterized protein C9374_004319 [Naegleria lovaniensis]KAG2383648.1 hypothetical protein C9374_004319 [Naegleria lovaniensis]
MKRKFVTPFKNPPPAKPSTTAADSNKASSTSSDKANSTQPESSSQSSTTANNIPSQSSNASQDQGNKRYTLFDSGGKQLTAKPVSKIETFREGDQMVLGAKLVEFMNKIKMEDYVSGRIFLQYNSNLTSKASAPLISKTATTKFKPHSTTKTAGLGYNNNEVEVIKAPEGTYILNEGHPEKDKSGTKISDVYIDNFIGENLRPHQVEGVKFMYECVMGMKDFAGKGMLLADEMGLGKTLQSIALIYTLLRRGPFGKPVIKKAIVVTNSSLVKNWTHEFDKWIGDDKIKVLTVATKTAKQSPSETLKVFKAGYHQVLIISYNLCTNYVDELQECQCDLLICDEGHKLKNANIKIFQTLKKLSTPRRIVLSGTPLQNDLNEFFTICDFINPGLLGDATSFKNLFTNQLREDKNPMQRNKIKFLVTTDQKS